MASQVQIPFEGVILQEHSAPISCPTPNFAKGSVLLNATLGSRCGRIQAGFGIHGGRPRRFLSPGEAVPQTDKQ